jgi:N-acetylneuraminic acid mutarotase
MLRLSLSIFYELFGKKKHDKDKCLLLLYLPDEVKLHIFSYLTVAELCDSATVCKEFRSLALDDSLWKRFFVKLNTKDSPLARVCHSAVVYGDKMYVYGGHVPDALNYIRDVKNDFYAYHFATKKWEVIHPKSDSVMPYKTEHTAVLYKNSMYLFGGYSGSQGYRDTAIYEFNFETRQCCRIEATGAIPPDRSAHTAVVYKDHMYIMGGWDGSESNNDFYMYNFESRHWAEVPSKGDAPPKIRSHSVVLYRDYMVVFGGYGENNHPASLYMYHFPTATWEEIRTPGPCGRSRFRMVYHDESIWCFGGWDRKSYFNDLWRFRFDTRTWQQIDSAFELQGVGQHSLVVHNGLMYLYGGYCADTKAPHPGLYVYRLPSRSAEA